EVLELERAAAAETVRWNVVAGVNILLSPYTSNVEAAYNTFSLNTLQATSTSTSVVSRRLGQSSTNPPTQDNRTKTVYEKLADFRKKDPKLFGRRRIIYGKCPWFVVLPSAYPAALCILASILILTSPWIAFSGSPNLEDTLVGLKAAAAEAALSHRAN
ncbi:hypothetical protein PRIPAC_92801, partial [Pristionchus pacificus]|uniref:Uncharacterized protein n=1 Tax=Pristionchus pacificus TaxID=54126 RepID=A0A2A6BA89_PRIPA